MEFTGLGRGKPALLLAPMEGVGDATMRDFLTRRDCGSRRGFRFDFCFTEFQRVSSHSLTARAFRRTIPEAGTGWCTPSGTPVILQLLGGDPGCLAESAAEAARAGALGVDLNFGCPAPTVNRHDGGATLLKSPERIFAIVRAVREAVPSGIPVSAKLRLGWDSTDAIHRNAEQAARAGASWITIHARTRMQSYRPPVFWEKIGEVVRELGSDVPIVANGDIVTQEDLRRCHEATGCEHFMVGRGSLVALPAAVVSEPAMEPIECVYEQEFRNFAELARRRGELADGQILGRIKLWSRWIKLREPSVDFAELLRVSDLDDWLSRGSGAISSAK